jgi:hypothetical protein
VIVSVILAILLGLGALAFIAAPLLRGRLRNRGIREEVRDLFHEKNAAILLLRDLDHDRSTGKLDDQDYLEQKAATEARALAVLRRLDEIGAPASGDVDPIEKLIREERRRIEKEARS